MWAHRVNRYTSAPSYVTRNTSFVDRNFQLKYTSVVLGAAALGMLISVFPIYYFLNENYAIFVDLAYEHSPDLLDYLERERSWINVLLAGGFTGTLVFFSFLGLKLTSRIVGPLKVMQNHIKALSRGNWSQGPIKVRETDEFQDLIESYNYFYDAFRVNLKRDLAFLKKLSIDPQNRDAYISWKSLIEEKSMQLGLPVEIPTQNLNASSASEPSSSPDRRHAS